MTSVDHDLIVVGAGPTGLFVAAEAMRAGIDTALVEARPHPSPGSRAIGLHPPVLAALEASGTTERILAQAVRVGSGVARTRRAVLGEVRFDRLNRRFPFVATVAQAVTEAALAAGAPAVRTGVRVTSLRDRGDRVEVEANAGRDQLLLRARLVVLAGGVAGRALLPPASRVHRRESADQYLMADVVDGSGEPLTTAVVTLDPAGVLESFPLAAGGRRIVAWDAAAPDSALARSRRLAHIVAARTGNEELAARVAESSTSCFGIRRILASRLRSGRVVVIGDAAHEISPIGGQGMNLGLLDAATLAPLLPRWLTANEPPAELAVWERRRLASARTAARLADLNTSIGRARGGGAHRAKAVAVRAALRFGGGAAAHAYAMGFDRDARSRE